MKRALLVAAMFAGCVGPRGVVVESDTEPVRMEGDYGPPCAVRVELDGHVYTFTSTLGCYVVRTQVKLPPYHVEGAGKPW